MVTLKAKLSDLAIMGGRPAFERTLHVGQPNVGDRNHLFELLEGLLDRRWFTNNGPLVEALERSIEKELRVKHCVAVCNGTIALEIAIRAVGMRGEVIVPSFTFVATAHALQWQNITPVFCDVDPRTHLISPARVRDLISPATTGILAVHLWGNTCDVEALTDIARERGLKLLFDAAHAFSCSHKGIMVGNFGDAEILSFHATKFFNTFEGGAVVTNDDDLAEKIRLMRNFGFSGYDNVIHCGINGKMTEVCAAMGLAGLRKIDSFIDLNIRNYKLYQHELQGIPGISLLEYDEKERRNYQYIVLEVDESVTQIDRDGIVEVLWAENVLARRYFYPGCHRMEPYRSLYPDAYKVLPETERICRRVLQLPTGSSIGPDEIQAICQILRLVIEHGARVKDIISTRKAS